MADYGYLIVAALVTDLDPNSFVKASMNDIVGNEKVNYYVCMYVYMYCTCNIHPMIVSSELFCRIYDMQYIYQSMCLRCMYV
jgi:hypothetical protein